MFSGCRAALYVDNPNFQINSRQKFRALREICGRHRMSGREKVRWAMLCGTVKWFDSKKGFGFIVNSDGKDVFVHFSSIEGDGFRALKDGETVEYEQIEGNKGLMAKSVRRAVVAMAVK